MEQVEVCNSWEEFEDNSKLLDQQLEKLKLQKGRDTVVEPESETTPSSTSSGSEAPQKMRVLKRNIALPVNGTVNPSEMVVASTNDVLKATVIQEESLRTQYVPPEPRISILSRPKKNSPEDMSGSNGKSKNQPVKTLEQREQEYAEARRRIFGDTLES